MNLNLLEMFLSLNPVISLGLLFAFGAILGSFLNVVILRFGTGMSISKGHSKCFSCGKNLHWWELVPIFSFLFLRGKCSKCLSKISWQYPLVELLTGVIFTALAYKYFSQMGVYVFAQGYTYAPSFFVFPIFGFLVYLGIFLTLIALAVYDLRHKIIPDTFSFLFSGLSLIVALFRFISSGASMAIKITDLMAGIIFSLAFYAIWYGSRGRAMGFGDVKLVFGIGLMLGLAQGLSALVMSFWIGAVASVGIMALSRVVPAKYLSSPLRELTMKSEVPFGPFLVLGTVLAYFYSLDVFSLSIFGF